MLEIRPCDFGVGVFTTENLPAGSFICAGSGALIDYAGNLALGARECDPLQIGPDLYLSWGEPARLLNHSCEPNCGLRFDGQYSMFALRDLTVGEQILWDYSTSMGTDDAWRMRCACQSPSCRKVIGPFVEIPAEKQAEYKALNIVLPYLLA